MEFLSFGDVARFQDTYQINVKALAAVNAKVLASSSARVQGDVATLDAVAVPVIAPP